MDMRDDMEFVLPATSGPALRVGFLLAPDFTLMALTGFVEVLRHAADAGDRSGQLLCSWSFMSHDRSPIRASCGLEIVPTSELKDPRSFDYLVVVGGKIPAPLSYDSSLIRYLQSAGELGVCLVGICTGSFMLASAGLMKGVRASVHWYHYEEFQSRFPEAIPVTDEIFTIDQRRITCVGGASTADLAAFLVEKHCGKDRATKSLRQLIVDHARPARHPQVAAPAHGRTPADTRLRKVVFLMEKNIKKPLSVTELAAKTNISSRQLMRLFQEEFGVNVGSYYRHLRLTHAQWLIENTDQTASEVAYEAGFVDASHLNKSLVTEFSIGIRQLRANRQKAVAT